MKIAIIGSRAITKVDISKYIPKDTTEIVSGGAKGIDTLAREYAMSYGIKLTEFLPDYKRYRKGATFKRNLQIIGYADSVLAFWDGRSKGTEYIINECKRINKQVDIIMFEL